MKYARFPGLILGLQLLNQEINRFSFSRSRKNFLFCCHIALALLSCFWVTTASALPPAVVGYSNYPSKPMISVPGMQPFETRPTPELACRELTAQYGANVITAAGIPTRVSYLAVTGSPPALQCGYMIQLFISGDWLNINYLFAAPIGTFRDCPAHATAVGETCECDRGYQEDQTHQSCEIAPPKPEKNMCGAEVGHPILPATGEKYRFEEDIADGGPDPLSFARIYRSSWAADVGRRPTVVGPGWMHSHDMALEATPMPNPTAVSIVAADGSTRGFTRPAGAGANAWKPTQGADRLTQRNDGDSWLYIYTRADDDAVIAFDPSGRLVSHTDRNGWTTRYTRDANHRLSAITNHFGRTLRLTTSTRRGA
jgi:YD repeat-containing protein